MTAVEAALEVERVPLCSTCVEPMALVRIITPTRASELRVFSCKNCGIVMFTEIP